MNLTLINQRNKMDSTVWLISIIQYLIKLTVHEIVGFFFMEHVIFLRNFRYLWNYFKKIHQILSKKRNILMTILSSNKIFRLIFDVCPTFTFSHVHLFLFQKWCVTYIYQNDLFLAQWHFFVIRAILIFLSTVIFS